ncbi:acyltransferase [Dysgonomonas termitidis]|uniref:Acyltransferase n=1 Tax=Dysgonomonas termitidis TaxID=1516126 RepID=A0ABV9KV19_9BACT
MKKREQYLDTLRSVACIFVVLTHSTLPLNTSDTSYTHAFISFICSPSSELFLAVSGALLLPVCRPAKEFLKKRFMRVFPPLLFWSCTIVIYRYFRNFVSLDETCISLICIPFKPVLSVYWFFYVISGLYIFAPIISKWLLNSTRNEMRLFLFLWIITLALASVSILLDNKLVPVNGSYYFILNSFGGFLGFMILGSLLRNHTSGRTVKHNIVIPLVILFSLFIVAVIGYKTRILTAGFFIENLSLPTALMVYAVFMLFKDIRFDNKIIIRIITEIATCSYGIYLIHILVNRNIVRNLLGYIGVTDYHAIITSSLSLILSLGISYGIIKLIKLLPYSKYIVG